jgi:hypothetical protein
MSRVQPTERDLRLLRRCHRYGMIDLAAIRATEGLSHDGAKSLLRRLAGYPPRYRFLRPWPLFEQRVYHRLTPLGCRVLGVDKLHSRPLGPEARAEHYALMWWGCLGADHERAVFVPHEFAAELGLAGRRLTRTYFHADERTLTLLLVDHRASVRRLVHKCCDKLLRLAAHGTFESWLSRGALGLTLLTTHEGKRRAILRGLEALDALELRVERDVVVVPGLDRIIPGRTVT